MKTYITILLTLSAFLITGCTEKNDPIMELRDEVMVVHDEVMPLTADLNQAIADLQKLEGDTSIAKLEQIKALRKADEAMFSWMGNFEDPPADAPMEDRQAYYKGEMDKISTVASQMRTALQNAQNYLDEAQ